MSPWVVFLKGETYHNSNNVTHLIVVSVIFYIKTVFDFIIDGTDVLVFLQWSGDSHGHQSALHPAAAFHRLRAAVLHCARAHRVYRLW